MIKYISLDLKHMLARLIFGMTLFAFTAIASHAYAADSAIGVVNVQKIMRDSKAAQSVRGQLQTKQKSFQTELDAKEKSLYDQDQALAKEQAASKDKAAFDTKVKAFREQAAAAQRDVQTKKAALDKAFAAALEQIQSTVISITKDVATEKKLSLVVSSAQVLYADNGLDVTDEVLKRLDAKLPSVAVKF